MRECTRQRESTVSEREKECERDVRAVRYGFISPFTLFRLFVCFFLFLINSFLSFFNAKPFLFVCIACVALFRVRFNCSNTQTLSRALALLISHSRSPFSPRSRTLRAYTHWDAWGGGAFLSVYVFCCIFLFLMRTVAHHVPIFPYDKVSVNPALVSGYLNHQKRLFFIDFFRKTSEIRSTRDGTIENMFCSWI